MSIVNLNAGHAPTEAEIRHAVMAALDDRVSRYEREAVLWKAIGALLDATGIVPNGYQLTADDRSDLEMVAGALHAMQTSARAARADAALLEAVLAHERAVRRLARYRLADGHPGRAEGYYPAEEGSATHATLSNGTVVPVEALSRLEPAADLTVVEWVQWQPSITRVDPLPATVERVNEDGTTTLIPNPAIVADDAERAEAQSVIDTALPEVLALVGHRGRV